MVLRKFFTSALPLGFFLFGLLFFVSTSHADPCNCPPMDDTDVAYSTSDLVMIGTVSDLKSSIFKPDHMEITFDIRKLIKSNSVIPTDTVVVYIPNNECKYDFQFGNDYIVYAKGDLFFFYTDVCSRNKLFDFAFDEVERLSKFDKTKPRKQTKQDEQGELSDSQESSLASSTPAEEPQPSSSNLSSSQSSVVTKPQSSSLGSSSAKKKPKPLKDMFAITPN